ncbi:MAG: host attachment protein [Gammaproteobacteria bacterium]|nr:host attachment protein [Gammaproteobacteria bacterium]MDH3857866.1 host attachment protein [Gammaproteobacteria bacterium]
MSICVVVADGSKARILVAESGQSPLIDDRDFIHPESRLREQDLVSDGTGSESDAGGYGKHSMGHERTAHDKEMKNFADELCVEIDRLRQGSDLRRVYLVASPKFLGLLRSSMNKQCSALLEGEISKDLVNHSIDDIRSHLPKRL